MNYTAAPFEIAATRRKKIGSESGAHIWYSPCKEVNKTAVNVGYYDTGCSKWHFWQSPAASVILSTTLWGRGCWNFNFFLHSWQLLVNLIQIQSQTYHIHFPSLWHVVETVLIFLWVSFNLCKINRGHCTLNRSGWHLDCKPFASWERRKEEEHTLVPPHVLSWIFWCCNYRH